MVALDVFFIIVKIKLNYAWFFAKIICFMKISENATYGNFHVSTA